MTDAKDIFLRAIDCTSLDERARLIDEACGDNAGLKRRVEALLAAHDDPDSYLERPAAKFDVTATHDGSGSNLSDSSSSHHGRFLPGTKVAGRYRIVSMLGRGGMGEVYRADDLRLGQTVALKFLPPELAKDAKRLEYFHNEVRLARQIAHPNVCRVYDIGEVDGQYFISMEYIDGEDLKTLLHRIGRLPNDKGSQIAQQLCAGLAAAHARGVLHRDLKPANIMIDGQGHARITDFGLATVSGDGENVIGMSGTPAYMAPEQLLRGQTSVQSDIYSLGLILYEAIVGKPAHVAESLDQLRQFHEESSGPRKPSSIEGSVDPVIERAICRCLEHSPEDRPKSVSELSLQLPGGDPLAAALAGGELPSPELLAASGESGVITKAFGLCLLAVTIVGIVLIAFLSDRVVNVNRFPSGKSPEFLKYRGRDIIEQLGYGDAIDDVAVGIHETKSRSLRFWLRTSPATFQDTRRRESVSNYVWFDGTPWHTVSMTGVELDLNGNVWQFRAVPPDSKLMTDAEPFSWDSVVTKNAFGLDLSELKRATWKIAPPVAFDHLESWEGTLPGTQERVYVQAASFQGRPVYWRRFSEVEFERASTISTYGPTAAPSWMYVLIGVIGLGSILGVHNLRNRKGDRDGAAKIVIVFGIIAVSVWGLRAKHSFGTGELFRFQSTLGLISFFAALIWFLYISLEPTIRRVRPNTMIAWSRLMKGNLRNPLVGRDVLVGLASGVTLLVIARLQSWHAGRTQSLWYDYEALFSVKQAIGVYLDSVLVSFFWILSYVFLFAVANQLLRRPIAAAVAIWALQTAIAYADGTRGLELILTAAEHFLFVYIASQLGLLALVSASLIGPLNLAVPLTANSSAYFFPQGALIAGWIIMVATAAFYSATRQPQVIRRTG